MHEATLTETPEGLVPADDGWFIVNARDIAWETVPGGGTWCMFERRGPDRQMLGTGIHVLGPGETPGFYHAESEQEGFLVLAGECLAVVEGQERRMRQWDYLHCPPGTAHITIGTGAEPCAIFMMGTRSPGHHTRYLAEPAAARHGAAVAQETDSPAEAYRDRPPITPVPAPWP